MLTKRAFLAGTAACVALPPFPARAAAEAAAEVSLRLEAASLPLALQGAQTPALRLVGDGNGALSLDPGRTSAIRFRNTTSEPATLEWRGLRGLGSQEQARPPVAPGATSLMEVKTRRGGTALLRAVPSLTHLAERGAVGVVVVPEGNAAPVDRDMVVMLNDWLLASDNSLRFGSIPPADAVAGAITVNGVPPPYQVKVAPRARLRLRFANASVQRLMMVACTGARPMIAAIDGQPSELFAPVRNTVPIGPGARYDLLLDMPDAANATVRFTLKPTALVNGKPEPERDLVVLSPSGAPLPNRPPLTPLPANPDLPAEIPLEAARRMDLTIAGQPGTPKSPPANWTVNGIPGSAGEKPVLTARRGEAVVFGLVNASPMLVPLRIAGHAVRLLHDRDDGWEPYWRDTLLLPPKSRSHVAFVADAEGHWPIDSGFDDLTLAGLSCVFSVTPR